MKLLYCQGCGDLVVPHSRARVVRWCRCEQHAVWWENPQTGVLRIYDTLRQWVEDSENGRHVWDGWKAQAYVIGLTNLLLQYPKEAVTAEDYAEIADAHEDYYYFKRWKTCVIRVRPGISNDVAYAEELP